MEEKSIMSGIRRAPMRYKIMAAHGLSVFVSGAPPEVILSPSEITISTGETVRFDTYQHREDATYNNGGPYSYPLEWHDNMNMEEIYW